MVEDDGGKAATNLHSPKPLRSCWHLTGKSSARGALRHSRGVWRWTMMQSDCWRHWARASPMGELLEGWFCVAEC
jgi:hypothetical protein